MDNPSKPVAETILHAIEELYFYRRYEEARKVTEEALKGDLGSVFKGVVEGYRERCVTRCEKRSCEKRS